MQLDPEIRVLVLAEPKTLYRGCFADDLEGSLMSNFQAGRSPHPADLRATVLHMAVSMFEDREFVRRVCGRNPQRRGDRVATVVLEPGQGVCVADTSGPGHWSVWGLPPVLASFVADLSVV